MSRIIRRGKLFYEDQLGAAIKEFAVIAHNDFVKNNWKWGKSMETLFKTGKDVYYIPDTTEIEAHLLSLYADHKVCNTNFGN